MGFFKKSELEAMKRRELKATVQRRTRNWKKRRRIPLRHDTTAAAPVVIRLFTDIQMIRGIQQDIDSGEFESDLSADVRARFERDAWNFLVEYLLTLEAPDHLHEPG